MIFSPRDLRNLLLPLMLEQILTSLMGTADTMMVTTVSSSAISAVSLVDSVNILMIQLFSAMATGGAIVSSHFIGSGSKKEASETGRQLILAIVVISAAIAALCALLRGPLLSLIFGTVEVDVMEGAKVYMLVTSLSFPFLALFSAGSALFRSCGNSRLPMRVSLISNCINIGGNALLIFVFKMGVLGVAIPTLVSRIFSAVTVLLLLRRQKQDIVVRDYRTIRPNFSRIRQIMRIGIPTGVENSMFQFGKLVVQSTISTMGTTAMAANAMAASLEQAATHAPIAIGLGLMTVIGQCMGAGEQEQAKYYMKKLMKYSEITLIISCAVVAALVKPITVITGMEQDAAELAIHMTLWISFYKPFPWVFSFIPAYGMRAAGDVKFPMIVSTCTMWSCRVAITVLTATLFHVGPMAMWIGMFSDWTIRAFIFTFRLRSGKWLNHKVLHA